MKTHTLFIFSLLFFNFSNAQVAPEIKSWIQNLDSMRGYGGLLTNVQKVQYSSSNVYVSCTCIPGYDIGPWAGNPNTPANQNFCFKITRTPQKKSGTYTATALGHIGVWTNGVSIFNAKDAFSYANKKIWNQNAITVEGPSFDTCLGHPAPNGEYHHHLIPRCLFSYNNPNNHSPIIGYAFDGFPIYGPYGFSDTLGKGTIKRMQSGYRLRNITQRTTLPNGTILSAADYGPNVNSTYILGYYIEDYIYEKAYGDLDEHNGRFCVTPEYPSGTYAYFVTIDSLKNAAYPYTVGETYYGVITSGNIGPGSGHNVPTESVVTYIPSGTSLDENIDFDAIKIYPNPAKNTLYFLFNSNFQASEIVVFNAQGKVVLQKNNSATSENISLADLQIGMYQIKITTTENKIFYSRFIKE